MGLQFAKLTPFIEALLAPTFQIRRADESTANKEQHLKTSAVVIGFEISDYLVGLQNGETLSVT